MVLLPPQDKTCHLCIFLVLVQKFKFLSARKPTWNYKLLLSQPPDLAKKIFQRFVQILPSNFWGKTSRDFEKITLWRKIKMFWYAGRTTLKKRGGLKWTIYMQGSKINFKKYFEKF